MIMSITQLKQNQGVIIGQVVTDNVGVHYVIVATSTAGVDIAELYRDDGRSPSDQLHVAYNNTFVDVEDKSQAKQTHHARWQVLAHLYPAID